ncbi:MAG: histidine kinase, partial [Bacteroidota bacterium]
MTPRRALVTLILYSLTWAPTRAQVQTVAYGVTDGLPTAPATAVTQDAAGFVWFGTVDGLAYTDGDGIYPVRAATGAARYVNAGALAPTPDGGLWVGTEDGVLFRDGRTGALRRIRDGLPSADVLSIARDGRRLWVGTADGLALVDGREARPIPWTLPGRVVRSLDVGADGSLWVGTVDGACVMPRGGRRCRPLGRLLGKARVQAIAASGEGAWLSTSDGTVARVDRQGRVLHRAGLPAPAVAVAPDASGGVWVATYGAGVAHVLAGGEVRTYSKASAHLPSDFVYDVHVDRAQDVWAATEDGVVVLTPLTPHTLSVNGLPDPEVVDLDLGPGGLLVGTRTGVAWARTPTEPPRPVRSARPLRNVTAVAADGAYAWVATAGDGVFRVATDGATTPLAELVAPPPPSVDLARVYDVAVADGAVWIATQTSGVCRATPGETTCWNRSTARSADRVLSLCTVRDGTVWTGRWGGGATPHRPAGQVWREGEALHPGSRVLAIDCSTPRPALALADGLSLPSGARPHGLQHPNVTCSVQDGHGRTWIGSPVGVEVVRGGRVAPLPRPLPTVDVPPRACLRWGNDLLFGTERGLLRLPTPPDARRTPPPVVVAAVTNGDLEGRTPPFARRLTLDAHRPDVAITLRALDFTGSTPVEYRLGSDSWQPLGAAGVLRLAGLRPGRYVLEARSSFAGAAQSTISIVVPAPLWARPWAIALVVGLVGLGVAGTLRARAQARERIERTRRQIADDLHDDVGSRLGGLALGLDVAARTMPDGVRAEVRERADEAREILGDLRDAVWLVDGAEETLGAVVERARLSAERLLPTIDLEVAASGELDRALTLRERRHLLFFCKEALHNAARHGAPTYVRLAVDAGTDGRVELSVEDDGRGFTPSQGGRGMATLRRRA